MSYLEHTQYCVYSVEEGADVETDHRTPVVRETLWEERTVSDEFNLGVMPRNRGECRITG